jgi:hypothetical protein
MRQTRKPLRSALHHWWPRSLSRLWADAEGLTYQLSWNRKLARAAPAAFGAIRNAHLIKYDDSSTNWDETFEPAFDAADGLFPKVVESLLNLDTTNNTPGDAFCARLKPQEAPTELLDDLTECITSLIVRSPAFRYSVRSTVDKIRAEVGFDDLDCADSLVGMNMRHCQRLFSRAMTRQGKFVVLDSGAREFIFGDGFLHNFSSTTNSPLIPRCLVPLTPSMSVLYSRPLSYRSDPKLMTLQLLPDEVDFLNDTIQIYSRDFIFFRTERPALIAQFTQRKFLQYRHHKQPWLDGLIDAASNACFRAT